MGEASGGLQRRRVFHRGEYPRNTGAVPQSSRRYRAVVAHAREYEGKVPAGKFAEGIEIGTADIRAGDKETAYGRFTRKLA